MKNLWLKSLAAICIILSLAGCSSGGNCTSCGSGYVAGPNGTTTISDTPLSNGSSVWSSSTYFSLPVTDGAITSGAIGLSGGSAGESYTLSFNETTTTMASSLSKQQSKDVTAIIPSATTVPNYPCPLIAESATQSSCQVNISKNAAPAGTYYLHPVITNNKTAEVTVLNPIKVIIGNVGAQIGNLSIVLSESSVPEDYIMPATVTLSNSVNVTNLTVNIAINDTLTATESPATCVLSTTSNKCTIIIAGKKTNSTPVTASASATGYTTVSQNFTVSPPPPVVISSQTSQSAESAIPFSGVADNTIFYISFTMTGGGLSYNQTFTPVLPNGMSTVGASSCTFSNTPTVHTCTLAINSGSALAGAQTISFSPSGVIAPVNFNLITYWTKISGGANQPAEWGYYGPFGTLSTSNITIQDPSGNMWAYTNESWTQTTSATGNNPGQWSLAGVTGSAGTATSTMNLTNTDKYLWSYQNGSWTQLTGASLAFGSAGGFSYNSVPNSIFAFNGNGANILYHYDGSNWSAPLTGNTVSGSPSNICNLVGNISLESMVIKSADGSGCTTNFVTWVYKNNQWQAITETVESAGQPGSADGNRYWSADTLSDSDLSDISPVANLATASSIILGSSGGPNDSYNLWIYNGVNWAKISNNTSSSQPHYAKSVWGNQTISSMVVTDDADNLWTYVDGAWSKLTTGTASASQPPGALSVSLNATPSEMYIVGTDNQLWHYANSSWSKLTGTAPAPLNVSTIAILSNPSMNSIVVADNSSPAQVWAYNGTSWNQRTGPSSPNQPQNVGNNNGYNWIIDATPNNMLAIDSSLALWIGKGFQ